jgi:hypothetical protein
MILYPRLARPAWVAFVAVILCGAGLISFLIEGSHYVMDHHFSLIASVPIVLIPIALWTIWKCMRQPPAQVAR